MSLEIDGLRVRPPTNARPVLEGLDLHLEPGETVGLLGRSGSGKTSLLHTIAGLVPWLRPAEVSGGLHLDGEPLAELDPGQRAHLLATCLDRPDAQLFLPTPRHELAAAQRLYGQTPFLERTVEGLQLGGLLDRRTTELSSGERQRVALAVSLSAAPRPVLLDEPTANLDASGVAAVEGLLQEMRTLGGSAIVADHAGWRLGGGLSRWVRLEQGRLAPTSPPAEPSPSRPAAAPGETVALRAAGLGLSRGPRRLLEEATLELRTGEVVAISGPNGVGKSTLARALAGQHRPDAGRVRRTGQVALMLPGAELQLFATTVAEEVAAEGAGREEVTRVLRRHRLEDLGARTPWSLSRGERQRLVHAALDIVRPAVLIVDELGQGLDPEDLTSLVELIHRRQSRGRAYILITHRRELAGAAHRHLELAERRLVPVDDATEARRSR